jgi:hypothetical protein
MQRHPTFYVWFLQNISLRKWDTVPLLVSWRTRACVEKLAKSRIQLFFLCLLKGYWQKIVGSYIVDNGKNLFKFLPKCKKFSRIRTIVFLYKPGMFRL